jgi:hypothetical protein
MLPNTISGLSTKYWLSHFKSNSEYGKPIYNYIKNGNAKNARLEYNRSTREWELHENFNWIKGDKWSVSSSYPANLKGSEIPDNFLEDCMSALQIDELNELADQIEGMVILQLYLYDHNGITMRTGRFSCPWDSGQVGWIYADYDMIKKEYGEVTPETIAKAEAVLEGEVKDYDYFLTGQCYGYRLFKHGNEIDSCWGFMGEIADVQKHITKHLPSECKNLVGFLEYHYDINELNYLEQIFDEKQEYEMGM